MKEIEDKIRKIVNARNVRLTEYFKDFDRLRTGFITSKFPFCPFISQYMTNQTRTQNISGIKIASSDSQRLV